MKYNELQVGQKIQYTGDMANRPAEGEIVKVYSNQFYPILYDIELNNGEEIRVSKCITPAQFLKSPGRRFILQEEYNTERKARMEELKAHYR